MPILGTLIKPVHIYAGTLKTPETGRKRTKTGITAGTIAGTMLLYCLPIIGSYTGGTLDTMPETEAANQNTMLTADRRKYINHSGIIGNSIPGSAKSAESVRS